MRLLSGWWNLYLFDICKCINIYTYLRTFSVAKKLLNICDERHQSNVQPISGTFSDYFVDDSENDLLKTCKNLEIVCHTKYLWRQICLKRKREIYFYLINLDHTLLKRNQCSTGQLRPFFFGVTIKIKRIKIKKSNLEAPLTTTAAWCLSILNRRRGQEYDHKSGKTAPENWMHPLLLLLY